MITSSTIINVTLLEIQAIDFCERLVQASFLAELFNPVCLFDSV
jgi:hypothetical protein